MKLAIVRTHLQMGGVEVNLQHIAFAFKEAGHDIDVYICNGGNSNMVALYKNHDISLKSGLPPRFSEYDAIICWDPRLYPQLALYQNTLVCIVGNRKPQYYGVEIRDRFPVAGCICDSGDTEDFVREFSDTVKCIQWYYMIPPADLARPRSGGDKFVVGTLCSMRAQKRVDRIIKGYAEYLKTIPGDSMLLIGGSGPMKKQWETLAKQLLPSDKFEFAGHIHQNNMGDFLSKIDCFVNVINPGEGGICMSVSNAVGAGCIPICNDVAGIKENFSSTTKHYLFDDKVFDRELPDAIVEVALNFDIIKKWRSANQESYLERYNNRGDIVKWIENLYHSSD